MPITRPDASVFFLFFFAEKFPSKVGDIFQKSYLTKNRTKRENDR